MKKILFALFFFQGMLSFGQSVGFHWVKTSGGAGGERGYSVAVDASGNVYTTGYFEGTADFDPGTGTAVFASAGDKDIFIQKHDPNGNFLWAKRAGSTGQDWGLSIAVDASGNVYTAGFFEGTVDFDPGTGVTTLVTSGSYYDIFIQKLDANGNFAWVKQIGSQTADLPNSIDVDASGNIYVTGLCSNNGTVDFDPGPGTYYLPAANTPIFVLKLDPNGNFAWAKGMGGISSDEGNSVTVDAAGNVYTTGFFAATSDFDPGPGIYNLTSSINNAFIQKLDANGNFVWAKQVTGNNQTQGTSIAVAPSGNIYVIGGFNGTADLDPGPGTYSVTSVGARDIFIQKLDANGNFVWGKSMGGSGNSDYGNAIALDASENVYTNGYFQQTVDFDPGAGTYTLTASANDLYILKLDPDGDFVWVKRAEGAGAEHGYSIAVNASGNIYTTGYFMGTTDFDPETGTHNVTSVSFDAFVLKLGPCEVNATDVQTACGSYTWINGVTYIASNTTATHTYTGGAVNGCDSVVTLNLTIKQPTSSTLTQTACGSYTLNGQTYNASGTYTQTLTNAQGCDSTLTLNLTIKQPTSATLTQTACGSYTLNGQTYNASGTYTQTLTNAQGCDSTLTLNLTVNHVNNTVTVNGITLTANQAGAVYQWLDCGNGNAPVTGATAQSFTPAVNGNYAVTVTAGGCSATSTCVAVNTVGVDENTSAASVKIYPNPATDYVHIDIGKAPWGKMELADLNGKLLFTRQLPANAPVDVSSLPAGIYFLKVQTDGSTTITKLVKRN